MNISTQIDQAIENRTTDRKLSGKPKPPSVMYRTLIHQVFGAIGYELRKGDETITVMNERTAFAKPDKIGAWQAVPPVISRDLKTMHDLRETKAFIEDVLWGKRS